MKIGTILDAFLRRKNAPKISFSLNNAHRLRF